MIYDYTSLSELKGLIKKAYEHNYISVSKKVYRQYKYKGGKSTYNQIIGKKK